VQAIIALLLGIAVWIGLSAPAVAQQPRQMLARPCVLATDISTTPMQAYARRAEGVCAGGHPNEASAVNWAIFDGLSLRSASTAPLRFLHAISRETSEVLWVVYDNGTISKSPTTRFTARQILSTADVSYELPPSPRTIRAILVRSENFHNARGLSPRAAIETHAAADGNARAFHLFYGLLGGLLIALLGYNFLLYTVMRHRFLVYYCLTSLSMISFGWFWSGAVFLVFPNFTTLDQITGNFLSVSCIMLLAPWFLGSFVEAGTIPDRLLRGLKGLAAVPLLSSLFRCVQPNTAWKIVDQITYGSMILLILGLIAASLIAWKQGSKAIKLYLLAWTAPMLMTLLRTIWGLGFTTQDSVLFDTAPFTSMAFEAVVSATGIVLRIKALQTEHDRALESEGQMRILAETDPMTGLLNRRAFLERARLGDHAKRLILADIDRFKAINDSFGHEVGDQVICAVAEALRANSPDGALVGRMGGEEFAVLVPADAAGELAYRLREAVENPSLKGGPPVTISAGVSEGLVGDETDWRLLYIAADEALFEAKRGGRNRVQHSLLGPKTKLVA
jgi:diguanylate cyclase (GGDEF)-like protein